MEWCVFAAREAEEAGVWQQARGKGLDQGRDDGIVSVQPGGWRAGVCFWREEARCMMREFEMCKTIGG